MSKNRAPTETTPKSGPLLDLVIADSDELGVPPDELGAAERETWRDDDGTVFAHGWRANGLHWLEVPEVGVFRFGDGERAVVAVPEPLASRAAVVEAFRRLVLPNALQALGIEVLHASAVRARAGVVALCARSRTGKSTLAFALSRRGHPLWADDAVAFTSAGRLVRALPLPFTIQLRPASASFFEYGTTVDGTTTQPDIGDDAPLTAVFLLERAAAGDADVAVRRLAQHEAFVALLANAYWFTLADEARKRRMLREYLEVSALVPVFALRFRPGFEHLDVVLDALERALVETVEDT